MKKLPKHEWLKMLVEHMQANGAKKIVVVEGVGKVSLYGYTSETSRIERTLHQVRNVGGAAEQARRLNQMCWQYKHWLEWVFIVQSRQAAQQQYDWIDWNELSKRGLLERINREIMHPLGLAVFRDPDTGKSGGALISPDGAFQYPDDAKQDVIDTTPAQFASLAGGAPCKSA